MSQLALQAAVEGFLRYLKVERQLSPLTHENYARQLAALMQLADEMKIADWSQLEPAHVRQLAARSRRAGLQPASPALRLPRCAVFWTGWSAGALKANPAKGIATPRAARHLPKTSMSMR